MAVELPTEVIYCILYSLIENPNDRWCLRATSILSRAFREPSQHLLMEKARVVIRCNDNYGTFAPLAEPITYRIAQYIKQITIEIRSTMLLEASKSDFAVVMQTLEMISHDRIEAFTLHGGSVQYCSSFWEERQQPHRLHSFFARICESPALRSLTLTAVPTRFIRYCGPSLRQLTIHRPIDLVRHYIDSYAFRRDIIMRVNSSRIALESLTLDARDVKSNPWMPGRILGILLNPQHWITLRYLSHLNLSMHTISNASLEPIRETLELCEASLEKLEIHLDGM
ncbi:hypothetical protein FA15DRAFT_68264 [Coprinopsis marcescibilis]|uniref:F-box domain-containing protein n=1 Tax=Coprinopsis marcescibilis TaxID=230819 RepID=A0A5C3KN84_COPMA|nr:hypothetical protein FA15DRAFT_68264 [Coprinopsis marcescibilis]